MSAHAMPVRYRMPFNFAQVIIAAFGAAVLCGFVFFVSEAAGASMRFSGELFQNLDFIHILRFTAPPILILGLLTFVIGRAAPRFCRIAQWLGVAVAVVSIIVPILFAEDVLSGIALALMHLIVGASWYLAVNNSNKKYNDKEAAQALVPATASHYGATRR